MELTISCGIFPTFRLNVRNMREYSMKYCQSHITFLWIWIMLWTTLGSLNVKPMCKYLKTTTSGPHTILVLYVIWMRDTHVRDKSSLPHWWLGKVTQMNRYIHHNLEENKQFMLSKQRQHISSWRFINKHWI